MIDYILNYIDYIFIAFHCVLFVIELIRSILQHKKIIKICEKCMLPATPDHECDISDKEVLSLLTSAIKNKDTKK